MGLGCLSGPRVPKWATLKAILKMNEKPKSKIGLPNVTIKG